MSITKLDKLKAQREELDKKIREVSAAESRAEREADKRRKIIIGGWVMKHRPQLIKELIANGLERDQDKAAFEGWAIPETKKTVAPAAAPLPNKEG